jgi:hypothetical protein
MNSEKHSKQVSGKIRANAFKTVKGKVPGSTFGRIPRSTRRSGFPLQVLLLPAVVVRAFRFNPLRGARGSRFCSLTGIPLKRSLFEIAALQCREMFTPFLNALTLGEKFTRYRLLSTSAPCRDTSPSPSQEGNLRPSAQSYQSQKSQFGQKCSCAIIKF